MVADALAERVVRPRAAEALDMLVLVQRRDPLGRELAADPVSLLQQEDAGVARLQCRPGAGRRQRGGDAAGAAAHHQHVAGDLLHAGSGLSAVEHGHRRVAGGGHGHDVEQRRHLIIMLGSQSASWGNAMTLMSATTWSAMKGQMEWKMSPTVMSGGVTPLR